MEGVHLILQAANSFAAAGVVAVHTGTITSLAFGMAIAKAAGRTASGENKRLRRMHHCRGKGGGVGRG